MNQIPEFMNGQKVHTDQLVFPKLHLAFTDLDLEGSLEQNPVLGIVAMLVQRLFATRVHNDLLNLHPLIFNHALIPALQTNDSAPQKASKCLGVDALKTAHSLI